MQQLSLAPQQEKRPWPTVCQSATSNVSIVIGCGGPGFLKHSRRASCQARWRHFALREAAACGCPEFMPGGVDSQLVEARALRAPLVTEKRIAHGQKHRSRSNVQHLLSTFSAVLPRCLILRHGFLGTVSTSRAELSTRSCLRRPGPSSIVREGEGEMKGDSERDSERGEGEESHERERKGRRKGERGRAHGGSEEAAKQKEEKNGERGFLLFFLEKEDCRL